MWDLPILRRPGKPRIRNPRPGKSVTQSTFFEFRSRGGTGMGNCQTSDRVGGSWGPRRRARPSESRCPTPFRIGFGLRGGDHGFRITGGFCQTSDRVGGPPPTLGFLLARERDRFKVARVSRIFTSQGAPSPDFRFRFCPYGYDGFRPDHVISDKQPAASAISNSRSRDSRAGHQKSKNKKRASL